MSKKEGGGGEEEGGGEEKEKEKERGVSDCQCVIEPFVVTRPYEKMNE